MKSGVGEYGLGGVCGCVTIEIDALWWGPGVERILIVLILSPIL